MLKVTQTLQKELSEKKLSLKLQAGVLNETKVSPNNIIFYYYSKSDEKLIFHILLLNRQPLNCSISPPNIQLSYPWI